MARSWPYLNAILAHLGLQDASKSLQDGLKTLQDAPKSLQDTPCRRPQNFVFPNVVQGFRVPELSWPNTASKTTSRASCRRGLGGLGGSWGRLGGSWGRLGGVLEALGGILKAKMSQDSAKMGPGTRQEQNPRELPSGLSPPSRRSEVQRAAVPRGRRQCTARSIFLLEEEHY